MGVSSSIHMERRLHAADPSTCAEDLVELSRDPTLAPVVAQNPSTPSGILERLADEYPGEVLSNPGFNALVRNGAEHLMTLLKWHVANGSTRVLRTVLLHPMTSKTVIDAIHAQRAGSLQTEASLHVTQLLPAWAANLTGEEGLLRVPHLRAEMQLLEGSVPVAHLLPFLMDSVEADRRLVPLLPTGMQPALLHLGEAVKPAWLELLARHPDQAVRAQVAGHPECPPPLLQRMAEHRASMVRCAAAGNSNTVPRVLSELMQDRSVGVRLAAIRNPRWSDDERRALLLEAEYDTRLAMASARDLTPDLLRALGSDRDSWVRRRLAENPITPPEYLDHLASDASELVRITVAGNPRTPAETLTCLATDATTAVRIRVAGNPRTPQALQSQLGADASPAVRKAVETRKLQAASTTSPVVATREATEWMPPRVPQPDDQHSRARLGIISRALRTRTSTPWRRFLVGHRECPSGLLRNHSRSRYWLVRATVAGHPNATHDVLMRLLRDGNQVVRMIAMATLRESAAKAM